MKKSVSEKLILEPLNKCVCVCVGGGGGSACTIYAHAPKWFFLEGMPEM